MEARRLRLVTQKLKRLFESGFFSAFGYRRTVTQVTTPQGVITQVLYVPPKTTMPPQSFTRRSALGSPSEVPTRSPAPRPFAYLGLDRRATRVLLRQTRTALDQLKNTGAELMRIGELLRSIQAQLGVRRARAYFERELAMHPHTSDRLIRVARMFRGHPRMDTLALLRPSLLYKLAEPSFPGSLREALIVQGLVIDGRRVPLVQLKVREVAKAKARWLRIAKAERDLRLRLSQVAAARPGAPELAAIQRQLIAVRQLPEDALFVLDEAGALRETTLLTLPG